MKYLITETQLKTLRKYMKTFINENVIRGFDALQQFPFSELPETYEEYLNSGINIEGWGSRVSIPIGAGTSVSIKSKEELEDFINKFERKYGEEPIFKILDSEKRIQISNLENTDSQQNFIASDERKWQDRRNRGGFN